MMLRNWKFHTKYSKSIIKASPKPILDFRSCLRMVWLNLHQRFLNFLSFGRFCISCRPTTYIWCSKNVLPFSGDRCASNKKISAKKDAIFAEIEAYKKVSSKIVFFQLIFQWKSLYKLQLKCHDFKKHVKSWKMKLFWSSFFC